MEVWHLVLLLVANVPVYVFWGWVIFGSAASFVEAIGFWFTPDIISALRGRFWDDWWAEAKLLWWGIACLFSVGPQLALLDNWVVS